MLAEAPVIGFIPVSDFEPAESFYCGRLGLSVVSREPYALVLRAAGGVIIRCVAVPDAKPQSFTIFGWEVGEISGVARALKEAGVEPILYPWLEQDQDGIWTAPGGARVMWFHDPFQNVLSLSQHAAATS